MTYEELQVGTVFKTDSSVFTKEEIMSFAAQYDPQYMHLDETKASAGQFGGIIASGLHTLGVACRLWVDQQIMGDDIVGGLGLDNIRFHRPVRPGDEISVNVTIVDKRHHARNPKQGMVSFLLQAVNQDALKVMDATLIGLVRRESA